MPTDQEQARLVMLKGPHPDRFFGLSEEEITVGREMLNSIVIGDPEVSRKHARLRRTEQGFTIEDLGSTNGTFVNGARITGAVPLADGDQISLGETIQLVYQRMLLARDRTVYAGAGRVTPPVGESELPAGPAADSKAPAEPLVEAGPPAPPNSLEPDEPDDAEILEPPPPFDEPLPIADAGPEPPDEPEQVPPPPHAPPSFEPLRPARYEERPEMPQPAYRPPRPPAREPGPPYRPTQRQAPSPPPYYEEYEPEPPQPRSKRNRTLLIGCGCLLLLFACAAVVGLGYLIWNAPFEFFQDPIRNFNRLFEVLTLLLVLP